MDPLLGTPELHRLGQVFYRRTPLYPLVWPHERLDEHLVATNADGSLIGMLNDTAPPADRQR